MNCEYSNSYFYKYAGNSLQCAAQSYSSLDEVLCNQEDYKDHWCSPGYYKQDGLTVAERVPKHALEINYTCQAYDNFSDTTNPLTMFSVKGAAVKRETADVAEATLENTCPPGSFSEKGMDICDVNLPGFVTSPNSGTPSPAVSICPEGYYCPPMMNQEENLVGIVQYSCPIGSLGVTPGAIYQDKACFSCPEGSYCEEAEHRIDADNDPLTAKVMNVARDCPKGSYCDLETIYYNENPCYAGFYGANLS
jgi:hypothetical protein